MILSLIVAMDERGGIGLNNRVPWHLPADLKRFKALTMGHHLIVGRKTYESIGRVLPGRTMIIITRSKNYQPEGCRSESGVRSNDFSRFYSAFSSSDVKGVPDLFVVSSMYQALHLAKEHGETEAFIGGGGMIYAQALPHADRIYLTRLHTQVEADVFFPPWDMAEWRVIHQEELTAVEGAGLASSFIVYERKMTGKL